MTSIAPEEAPSIHLSWSAEKKWAWAWIDADGNVVAANHGYGEWIDAVLEAQAAIHRNGGNVKAVTLQNDGYPPADRPRPTSDGFSIGKVSVRSNIPGSWSWRYDSSVPASQDAVQVTIESFFPFNSWADAAEHAFNTLPMFNVQPSRGFFMRPEAVGRCLPITRSAETGAWTLHTP